MTLSLPRLKPDPVPGINPVPEYQADARPAAIYLDTKTVLPVPWMGVVTMAFAQYPQFWKSRWAGIRPLAQSAEFAAAARRLRRVAESGAAEMSLAELGPEIEALGYGSREIAGIRAVIETFSSGNMPYLLIATTARYLLEGGELSGPPTATAQQPSVPAGQSMVLTLMEPHHADPSTERVFSDIRQTMGLPFVNTDYRALARWPSYFRRAWADLKPHVGSVDHLATVEMMHNEAMDAVANLPNPGQLTCAGLRRAAERDEAYEEIINVVRLFQWLLPELVVNVACLRAQLREY